MVGTTYRIYTEDKNREEIEKLVETVSSSFTIIPAKGYWNGEKENSLIIEINFGLLSSSQAEGYVRALAHSIKQHNHQQTVLVERYEVESILV